MQKLVVTVLVSLALTTAAVSVVFAAPKATITFLARDWAPELEWEREILAAFEQKNPDIQVEIVTYPAGGQARQDKLNLLWATGSAPDVWGHGGPVKTFDVRGWLYDMSPFVRRDVAELRIGDFFPAAWNAYRSSTRQWGLTMNSVGTFMVHNRSAFAEAGLAPPPTSWDDPSWTYEAMVQAARKMTRRLPDGRVSQFGLSINTQGYDALMWAWYWGGDWFDKTAYESGVPKEIKLTGEKVVGSVERIMELLWDLAIIPGGRDPWDTAPQGNAFLAGKLGMSIIPGWSLSDFLKYTGQVDWGLAAVPQGVTRENLIYTDPWLIGSQTKHPEAAWRLVKYLVSEEVMTSYSERMSFAPARKSAAMYYIGRLAEQARMREAQVMEVLGGAQEYGRESPDHTLYAWDTVTRILDPILSDIYARRVNPREGLQEAERRINAALKEAK